ncbi:hypothetical protein JXM67_07330 [candidate division WOR-3 bacterium]|nr:hypothetical protein [candidate division WOR-3 bacterium]
MKITSLSVVITMLWVCVSSGYENPRFLTITSQGEVVKKIDVTGKNPEDCYLMLGGYYVPWRGEDSLDFHVQDSMLLVNGNIVGISGEIDLSELSKPDSVYHINGKIMDYSLLPTFVNLICLKLKFSLDTCMSYFQELSSLKVLDLASNPVTDLGLARIKDLKLLRDLNLEYTEITDTGMACLSSMISLKELDLSSTSITCSGLDTSCMFRNLEELNLSNSFVNDEGLRNLSRCENLKTLTISNHEESPYRFAIEGLSNLKRLKFLEDLQIFGPADIDGDWLAVLCEIPTLKKLHISGEYSIGDSDLKHFSGLKNLQQLELGYGNKREITDVGLENLSAVKTLKYLSIWESDVSDDGLSQIKHALPECKMDICETGKTILAESYIDLEAMREKRNREVYFGEW